MCQTSKRVPLLSALQGIDDRLQSTSTSLSIQYHLHISLRHFSASHVQRKSFLKHELPVSRFHLYSLHCVVQTTSLILSLFIHLLAACLMQRTLSVLILTHGCHLGLMMSAQLIHPFADCISFLVRHYKQARTLTFFVS